MSNKDNDKVLESLYEYFIEDGFPPETARLYAEAMFKTQDEQTQDIDLGDAADDMRRAF